MRTWVLFNFCVLFVSCDGFLFNVSRGGQGSGRDIFSNMDPSGKCPRTNDDGRRWCLSKNADCGLQGCCVCACKYDHSTFRMGSSVDSATCVRNNASRRLAGCTQNFQSMSTSQPLVTLNLQVTGFKGITGLSADSRCKIKSVFYLDRGKWENRSILKYSFDIKRTGLDWPPQKLTWDGNVLSSFFGYIMKVNAECNQTGPGPKKRFCVVFKTNGTRSWNVPDPTTKTRLVISTRPTTTKASATAVQAPSKQRTSQQIRTKEVAAKTSPTTTRVTNISTESTATTSSQTEPVSAEVTTAEPSTHFKPGNNHKLNGNEEREHHTMMIAFITGSVAVICVAVILLCIWLIISQRRKNRCPASYVAGTTVVANPTTGSQNHFPMPGLLKNPVFDDSVYAELEDNTKKSTVGLLGQASYEIPQDILVKNPGADDIRMKPMNTRSRKILREHPHDSTEQLSRGKLQDKEKPVYHNPEYLLNGENPACQGLIKEGARARCNCQSNVDTYQSLDPDRLMYQPLKKSVAPKGEHQIPEYLALLNPNETSSNNSPNPPEYQPPYSTGPPPENLDEQPEYADYADLDELEEIALKEVSEKCSNEDSCYEVPVDNVPREPSNDYALPVGVVFDALEGHDSDSTGCANQGYERHIYAVLVGPDTSP